MFEGLRFGTPLTKKQMTELADAIVAELKKKGVASRVNVSSRAINLTLTGKDLITDDNTCRHDEVIFYEIAKKDYSGPIDIRVKPGNPMDTVYYTISEIYDLSELGKIAREMGID